MDDTYIQCAQAISQFYQGLDLNDIDVLLNCVEPDTVWHRQGKMLTGVEEIRQALEARNAERVTFHQVSNLAVQHVGDVAAVATYFLAVHDNLASSGGIQLKTVLRITDRYAKKNRRWRLAEKRSAKHL